VEQTGEPAVDDADPDPLAAIAERVPAGGVVHAGTLRDDELRRLRNGGGTHVRRELVERDEIGGLDVRLDDARQRICDDGAAAGEERPHQRRGGIGVPDGHRHPGPEPRQRALGSLYRRRSRSRTRPDRAGQLVQRMVEPREVCALAQRNGRGQLLRPQRGAARQDAEARPQDACTARRRATGEPTDGAHGSSSTTAAFLTPASSSITDATSPRTSAQRPAARPFW
jgi:hypothetical protein